MPNRTAAILLLLVLGFVSCGEENQNPTGPSEEASFMKLDLSRSQVGVGLTASPVTIAASVTRDATGETCSFTATRGSFNGGGTSASALIDLNGVARVDWFPPTVPGTVRVTAAVGAVAETRSIEVLPVPATIALTGLPDTTTTGDNTLFAVAVPVEWAGLAVEVSTTMGILTATGPVDGDVDTGNRIRPLTDQTGGTQVQFTAPGTAASVVLTVALFGTQASRLVEVVP